MIADAYSLPISVTCSGQTLMLRNRGDWRTVIDAINALTDVELDDSERVIAALLIFYDVSDVAQIKDVQSAVNSMNEFFSAGMHDDDSGVRKPKLVDWQDDAALIVSGINSVIGQEVRAIPYMHWWTFIAAYMAIGESTLSTVVGIRSKLQKGKKLEKHEQEFRRENPSYFNMTRKADKAAMDELLQMWDELENNQ